jgi:hypothetical protein
MSTVRKPRKPRGPIDNWSPNASTRALIADVLAILEEFAAYWPLSVRAVYYRLLGTGRYAKGAGLASRVSEHVSNARRAGVIPWEAISDSSAERFASRWWRDERDWLEDARSWAEQFRLNRQEGQEQRLLVWCEAKGMAPMLASVADEYGVEVLSGSGYDSTTIRHDVGTSTWELEVPLVVLHVGDLDPDGRAIYGAAAEDVVAWAEAGGGEADFERLAVTPAQVTALDLPDDPTHPDWVQAEAIAPDLMTAILRDSITSLLDGEAFADVLAREAEQRSHALAHLSHGSDPAA